MAEGAKGRVLNLAKSDGGDEMNLLVTNACGVEVWGIAYTALFPEVSVSIYL